MFIDGDVLNKYDGEVTADGLLADINGQELSLKAGENKLDGMTVYYHPDCTGYFRISVDDNILFLQDITDNADIYTSIFDNPYLAAFKKTHDLYGACVHINLFWEFDDDAASRFTKHKRYFNLSMTTDKFRDEFDANSDWLHLSFHAKSEFPDKPYEFTDYERIDGDIKRVKTEIERFAGKRISPPVTTLHWGASNETGVRALYANGYKLLNAEFALMDGKPFVSYYHDVDTVTHCMGRDFWIDHKTGVIFSKYDIVLNHYKAPFDMLKRLEAVSSDPHTGGFLEMLIHEQYFYDDYQSYIPEYGNIILAAAKFAHDTGHTGKFFTDVWKLK